MSLREIVFACMCVCGVKWNNDGVSELERRRKGESERKEKKKKKRNTLVFSINDIECKRLENIHLAIGKGI